MATKIRLMRLGKKFKPFYRIVVSDARVKRDGRFIEQIGKYNPMLNPSLIEVTSDRAQYWLSVGAQPTDTVLKLLKLTGDWQKFKGEEMPGQLQTPQVINNKEELIAKLADEAEQIKAKNPITISHANDEPEKTQESEEGGVSESDSPSVDGDTSE